MDYKVFEQGMLQTNCIVLQRANKCVVVDVPYYAKDVADFVKQNGLTVVAVLLTHGHFDHCGGVSQFLQWVGAPQAPVLVHKNDVCLCQNAANNLWGVPCKNCTPTGQLTDGPLHIDGFDFEVLETFGHTAGSVTLVIDNLMLSGDTLFAGSIGRTDFPESDFVQMRRSLAKLAAISGDFVVIPGHGPATTLSHEKAHNPYLTL